MRKAVSGLAEIAYFVFAWAAMLSLLAAIGIAGFRAFQWAKDGVGWTSVSLCVSVADADTPLVAAIYEVFCQASEPSGWKGVDGALNALVWQVDLFWLFVGMFIVSVAFAAGALFIGRTTDAT